MSEQAAEDADLIRNTLTKAGWEGSPKRSLGVPSFTYDNGDMTIELEQERGKRELLLTFEGSEGSLTVYPVYGERLEATLAAIVAIQDTVASDTLQTSVAHIVRACPEVYIQREEDEEPMLLEDDLDLLDPDAPGSE